MSPEPVITQKPWHTIWEGADGIWKVLTESELRFFALEQLAINWAEGRAVTA